MMMKEKNYHQKSYVSIRVRKCLSINAISLIYLLGKIKSLSTVSQKFYETIYAGTLIAK